MWLLVGMTLLLGQTTSANINDENAYYLAETDRSFEDVEKNGETTLELATPEATDLSNDMDDRQKLPQDEGSLLDYSRLKDETKRSIVRRSEHLQAPAPLATLLYWPDQHDQVIGMEGSRNPLIEERRNPSFSPWGGKRDSPRYKTIMKIRRPVRVPFNSWGGKRSEEKTRYTVDDIKRESKSLNWDGRKTPPFNSWGGKRASPEFHVNFEASPKNHYETVDKNRDSRQSQRLAKMDKDYETFSTPTNPAFNDQADKFTNDNEIKSGSVKMIPSGEMATSGSTMGRNFPRAFETSGGQRKEEFTIGDDQVHSESASLILRKIGRIPWIE